MESPTKEIEEFENNSLKYLQPEQIEKIWLRLRGLRKYKKTSQRLRSLVKQLERGEASVVDLKKNLEYAATVLESVYIDETRRLLDTEDELSGIQSDSVPSEVRDWLASTFTRQMGMMLKRTEEKPRFRSIVHAVQAGIFVERMYRRTSNMVGLSYPPAVIGVLKNVDNWSFDVFALNDASGDHALKFIFYELLTRYDLIHRFKIPISALVSFVEALEAGYSKHKNPYHNLMHAADVSQTVHYLLFKTGTV
ncbi:calcium/calmodulin-dependent 3',5'-cyclic nucleotide phosphodiesterase 1C, partial [Geospiza fortis]